MPTERCWKCHQMKRGIELCPSDDRLCPDCFRENERQLNQQLYSASDADTLAITSKTDSITGGDSKKTRLRSSKTSKSKGTASTASATQQNIQNTQSEDDGDSSHGNGVLSTPSAAVSIDRSEELSELRQLVSNQQLIIKKLQNQLNFVLSFLGITETLADLDGDVDSSAPAENRQSEPYDDQVNHPTNNVVNDQSSWTAVSKRQHNRRRDTLPRDTFQQSVIAAVYVDQSEKSAVNLAS